MKKVSRWKKICWCCFNELIKGFWLHTSRLFISKMYTYGTCINAVTFLPIPKKVESKCKNYLTTSQRIWSSFISTSPRPNIWSFLFNIFINDPYLWITKTDLLHFADDNIISAAERTIENLICTRQTESKAAIEWFKLNEMKLQVNVVKKNAKMKVSYPLLNINDRTINSRTAKLLGIEIDNKLSIAVISSL